MGFGKEAQPPRRQRIHKYLQLAFKNKIVFPFLGLRELLLVIVCPAFENRVVFFRANLRKLVLVHSPPFQWIGIPRGRLLSKVTGNLLFCTSFTVFISSISMHFSSQEGEHPLPPPLTLQSVQVQLTLSGDFPRFACGHRKETWVKKRGNRR